MKYGNCLQSIYKHKSKFSELLYESFKIAEKSEESTFDFSYILKNDKNSWKFYCQSLDYIYLVMRKVNNDIRPEESCHLKNITPILVNLRNNCSDKDYQNFINPNFLKTYSKFGETISKKIVNHIYIETEALLDFLTTVEVKKIDDLRNFILNNGIVEDDEGIISFAFHLPNFENGVALHLDFSEKNNNFLFYALQGETFGFKEIKEKTLLQDINESDFLKLLFNSICYTNCFVDFVKDGVPNDAIEKKDKKSNYKTLKPIKEIENFTQKDIVAHFRHAHFRFCGSDYFKEKKGKWVFVKGSMVNAEAKTIVEDD